MFCHKCGNAIPEGSAFCPKCGERVVGTAETAATETAAAAATTAPASTETPTATKGTGKNLLFRAKRSVCARAKRLATGIGLFALGLLLTILMFIFDLTLIAIVGIVVALVGVGIFVYTFIEASHYEILFYDGKVVVKSGVFNTREDQSVMTPVIGVRVVQSFWGKIFNYGTVIIDKAGRGWDVKTSYLKDPQKVKAFVESLINETDVSKLNMVISN